VHAVFVAGPKRPVSLYNTRSTDNLAGIPRFILALLALILFRFDRLSPRLLIDPIIGSSFTSDSYAI
jgi:hypothetical protein